MDDLAEELVTEPERVESWRLHNLVEAGYPLPLAEHQAVELVAQGCAHQLAAEILL